MQLRKANFLLFMKNLKLYGLLPLLAVCFAACSDDPNDAPPVTPTVKIEVTETLEQSAAFTVTTQHAVELFWLCQPASEQVPTAETLKTNGTKETEAEFRKNIDQLLPATEYGIYVLALGQDNTEVMEKTSFRTVAPTPKVQMTLYAATERTATVIIAPADAQKCAWLCLPASETAPDAATVLAEGQEVDCTQDYATVTIEELTPATDYKLYVAVEAYENTAMETLEFTTEEEVVISDFEVTFSACKDNIGTGGNHVLKLNDANWHYEMTLSVYAEPSAEHLPAGTYPVGESTEAPVLNIGASYIDSYASGFTTYKFTSGELKVEENNGTYVLTLNAVLDDGKSFKGIYEGALEEITN